VVEGGVLEVDDALSGTGGFFATVRTSVRSRRWIPPAVILTVIVLWCVLAPLVAPYSPTAFSSARLFARPSAAHWFGTDELGRDLFTRVLYGGRISLLIATESTALAMVIGALWGVLAALGRSWVSEGLMRLADVAMGIPAILLALVFVAAVGSSTTKLAIIIGVLLAPHTARFVRALTLTENESDYADAARAYGASRRRLVVRELLPNMAPSLIVQASVNAATAILLEAALSFIGVGIQPPAASWGSLVRSGYDQLYSYPAYAVFPGAAIVLAVWALNTLGDGLGATPDLHVRSS
jgi:peptide/nickel transport system permease protein